MGDDDEYTWVANLSQLIEVLIDDEAYANQKDYIVKTKNPANISAEKWVLRLKAINSYLPYLGLATKEAALNEEELVKIISSNIPKAWKIRFRLANGHKSKTATEALKILSLLEKEEKRLAKTTTPKGRGGGPSNGRGKRGDGGKNRDTRNKNGKDSPRNPCRLPGHQNHDYSDCKFNPKSAKFCGTVRTLKGYNEDGKRKDSTKKREKERENNKVEEVSESDSDNASHHYLSESDDCEFYMLKKKEKTSSHNDEVYSAEILISIPDGVKSKKYTTYRGLIDSGSSHSLASSKIVGPRYKNKKIHLRQIGRPKVVTSVLHQKELLTRANCHN